MLLSPCYYASDVLEWNLKLLMSGVDTVYQDSARLVQYEKKQALNRQARQQFIQKRVSERTHTHTAKVRTRKAEIVNLNQ